MLSADYIASLRRDLSFEATLRDRRLQFRTTWGLFSPREIDAGTRLLLSHIEVLTTDRCLDLGCGYGPIGLALAASAPQGHATMVDKDFVAVDYARRNAELNGLPNCTVLLSNGLAAVRDQDFDIVASNLPAKVGKELLYLYFLDALAVLRPQGRLYVVTLSGMRRFIERCSLETFGHYNKIKQGKDYTVALAIKQPP